MVLFFRSEDILYGLKVSAGALVILDLSVRATRKTATKITQHKEQY